MAAVLQHCGWASLPKQPENPSPNPLLPLPMPSKGAQGSLQQLWHAFTVMSFHQIHEFLPQASLECQLGWAARFWPWPHHASPSPVCHQPWQVMAQQCLLGCSLSSPLLCLCEQLLVRTEVLPHCLPLFFPPVQGWCDWSPWCSEDPSLVAELALV